ncbi:MAG TPA: ATP-binding protein [Candidatus Competibacteraceae bacterium]|nr:ATP-binding protein [Candidatus Competibacteraceae bacterium]
MPIELWLLFVTAVAYLGLLFLVAYAAERGWLKPGLVHHPLTYSLSMGVYATSWTYYGSVGLASQGGYVFLTVYLGVTAAFALTPLLLQPLARIVRDYQLASIADLFAFRYPSRVSGLLVTLFMLIGILPYLSLQIQAITESARVIVQDAPPDILALVGCVTLTLFAILFGARHLTPRDKHEGLVAAIAFESAVKLIALLSVGGFALFGVLGGPDALAEWLAEHPERLRQLYDPVGQGPWLAMLFLAFCAAFLLPRQFHMTFAENNNPAALKTASWLFPLYLLLLNLPIVPILWAGIRQGTATAPDFYAVAITLNQAQPWLPLLAFVGGVSAASAMMIVEILALASMCMNHLILPVRLLGHAPQRDLYRWILWTKRLVIALIFAAAYAFHRIIEHNQGLAQLGLISFVAAAQLLPGVLGILFWPRATRIGFIAGLCGGAVVWFALLILPLTVHEGTLTRELALSAMFGEGGANIWSVTTFWSLTVNALLFVLGSLLSPPILEEAEAAEACRPQPAYQPLAGQVAATSPRQFEKQLAKVMGSYAAHAEVLRARLELGLPHDEERPTELRRLRERIHRNLSGLLGPALARLIVDDQLRLREKSHIALAESIRYMEEQLEESRSRLRGAVKALDDLRRYHRDVLHTLPIGVCAVSPQGEVLIWNDAMQAIAGVDARQAMGRTLANLPVPWGELLADFAASAERNRAKQTLQHGGRWRSYRLHKAQIEPSQGQPREAGGLVILVEDRTDLDTLEAELAHSERLASIGRFAAGVAHEIGNPVTGIACIAQNLIYEDDPERLEAAARDILTQTQRISDIVKTLLAFSHGEPLARQPPSLFRLRDCVLEAVRLVRLSHAGRQVQLDCRVGEDFLIRADRQRMAQVFVNLLANACEASDPHTRVEVVAEADGAEHLLVHIYDQGRGIPEEIRQRIFEPFFTTKSVGEGTGLGLSLVHSIIEEHHGSIQIRSRPEQGTVVTLRLPRAAVPAPPEETIIP